MTIDYIFGHSVPFSQNQILPTDPLWRLDGHDFLYVILLSL